MSISFNYNYLSIFYPFLHQNHYAAKDDLGLLIFCLLLSNVITEMHASISSILTFLIKAKHRLYKNRDIFRVIFSVSLTL